jgi:hypothetical protein
MCFVQTPYYHLCGHYGRQVVAPHGRCARAEHTPGACWEPQDIGVRTVEAMCLNCERSVKISGIHQLDTTGVGPVDCHKFNQLVKLHKQTCDRRYCLMLFTLSLSPADNGSSASEASNSSSIISTPFLQTAEDLALRRHSIASEVYVVSTSTSTTSTGGRPPMLIVGSSHPVFHTPNYTSVEEWNKQAPENEQKSPKAPILYKSQTHP